jgi:malonyl-CoA O-methyltransferase
MLQERNRRMAYVSTLIRRMLPARDISQLGGMRRLKPDDLNVRDAYRLWAPTYAVETATSTLDEQLAQEMLRDLPRTRLLDAGCGIGRRILGIPNAIGIDLSPEMLASGQGQNLVNGDIRRMPFAPNQFDMVWCRLVIGHLPDPFRAYREFCRVSAPGAYIFVTDFHPDAVLAGHRRTMTGSDGTARSIEHYVHPDHVELAKQAGLMLIQHRSGKVAPSIRHFYEQGIGLRAYRRDLGLNLVEAMLFRKPAI